jgi:hypothetical protein
LRTRKSGCSFSAQNDHAENKNRQRTGDRTKHQGSTHGYLLSRQNAVVKDPMERDPSLRRLLLPSAHDDEADNDHSRGKGHNANDHA